jgi:hypothetical protein
MKNIIYFLVTALCCIGLVSCSNDEPAIPPPVVIVPPAVPPVVVVLPPVAVIPVSSLMKPAIRNINLPGTSKISKNYKIGETRKHIIKSFRFAQNRVNTNYKYILYNMSNSEYSNLPTDNLYQVKEDSLNLNTEVEFTYNYKYNALNQLSEIHMMYILAPSIGPVELFTYSANGLLDNIISVQSGTYTYNTSGLIDKMFDRSGTTLQFTYQYDTLGRVIDVYHYTDGIKKDMHYTYSYPDASTYIKSWFAINPSDQSETKTSYVTYIIDPTKPGIYNKEPVYQIDNSYLHFIQLTSQILYNGSWRLQFEARPKYFYNADGYLIKYDSAGFNYTSDITVFRYE